MLYARTATCLALAIAAAGMAGCQTVASHRAAVQANENRSLSAACKEKFV